MPKFAHISPLTASFVASFIPITLIIYICRITYFILRKSLITELPDRVARWSGASGEGLGESGHFEEANRTVVAGVMTRTTAYGQASGAASRAAQSGANDAEHQGRKSGAAPGAPANGVRQGGPRPATGPKQAPPTEGKD